MRTFLLAILLSVPLLASAKKLSIVGTWAGGDAAAEASYGLLVISETNIAWGPSSKERTCHASYTLISRQDGIKFNDQLSRKFLNAAGSILKTYLLKLHNEKCTNRFSYLDETGASYLRFTVGDESSNFLVLEEYNELGTPLGLMTFDSVKPVRNLTTHSSGRATRAAEFKR